jgi:GDP-L-fucose synthase
MTKIYVAGHRGLVGSTIVKMLLKHGVRQEDIITRTHSELDLTDQRAVNEFFLSTTIDQVYFAAAKVGGVVANNNYPAEFIYKNLMMQTNVINAAHVNNIQKFLMIGSTCIYPRVTEQPIKETALLTGYLESTNEPYAVAKIAALKMCESYNRQYNRDYRAVLPCNVYGPGDNYDPINGHVTAGMIRNFHNAKIQNSPTVKIWGTGTPRREFLYSEDMAVGCITVMNLDKEKWDSVTEPMRNFVNLGQGTDITIKEMAQLVSLVVGFDGSIEFDTTKPDGTMYKCTDNSKMHSLGWHPRVKLMEGLQKTYAAYLETV